MELIDLFIYFVLFYKGSTVYSRFISQIEKKLAVNFLNQRKE